MCAIIVCGFVSIQLNICMCCCVFLNMCKGMVFFPLMVFLSLFTVVVESVLLGHTIRNTIPHQINCQVAATVIVVMALCWRYSMSFSPPELSALLVDATYIGSFGWNLCRSVYLQYRILYSSLTCLFWNICEKLATVQSIESVHASLERKCFTDGVSRVCMPVSACLGRYTPCILILAEDTVYSIFT